MSGRYALFRWNPSLAALPGFPADWRAHWNISPANQVLMVREDAGARRADLARWGLTPAWLTDLSRTPSHARAETLAEQPMFREAFQQRRCLLPANGFYEWRGVRKRPYWVSTGERLLFFAGIWEAYPVQGQTWLSVAQVSQASRRVPPAAAARRGRAGYLAGSGHAAAGADQPARQAPTEPAQRGPGRLRQQA